MKVVLVVLGGDIEFARQSLIQHFPDAVIEIASREELQDGNLTSRFSSLRSRQPDIFAILTERLDWQRGQEALLLFGALAGARRAILFDRFGGWRESTRAQTLLAAPVRLLSETAVSRR